MSTDQPAMILILGQKEDCNNKKGLAYVNFRLVS